MYPLTAQQERKTRKDYGTRRGHSSTSSSSAFGQPSSSHLNDDDDGNDEGTSRASTPSPTRFVNSLTNKSKPQSLPPSSNDTPSPQPSNPFLDDIMDVPPRLSNPLLLQGHPSFDITLSLSPITPLDHILGTPSPPSPQPPHQPPLMGHPIYFNMFDYHR
ncbi:hypothetical protein Tco_1334444, partial [Tanacetum coccineum]